MITLKVSDAALSATTSFLVTVTAFKAIVAVTGSAINDPLTWGTAVPVAGDTAFWQTGNRAISMGTATETFYGGTFEVQSGGSFSPGKPGATLTLNNLSLNGGTISMANNTGLTIDLSGDQFTLLSGTLKTGPASSQRSITFQNGTLAGNGTIHIVSSGTGGDIVRFNSSIASSGFTGIFSVHDNGVLQLPDIGPENASFGVKVTGTGFYQINADAALTSLVLGSDIIAPGTYTYSDFTPSQQAFLSLTDAGGSITVADQIPTISAISGTTLAANTSTGLIPFSIADIGTPVDSLSLSATSSNPALVPPSGVQISGTGSSRFVRITPAADRLGTSLITLAVGDGSSTASASFLVTVTGTPVETWRFAFFGSSANSGSGAESADPDSDGWTNAQEYAMGSNPMTADSFPPLAIATSGSSVTLTFIARQASGSGYAGLARYYDVETSASPSSSGTWTGLPNFTGIAGANQTVNITQSISPGPVFYRLKASVR